MAISRAYSITGYGCVGQDVQLSYHETTMLSGLGVKDADELRDFTTRQGAKQPSGMISRQFSVSDWSITMR